ncbi:MAG: hypothetical protein PHD48_01380 [Alphaproteobacteria bacterium]|nr:hypothetical protein [Alphaproteobacteria bacterium]
MDRDIGGFMWGMKGGTQTKTPKFLLPSWVKTGVIATSCLAVLGASTYAIYSVNHEPVARFKAVQAALSARESCVIKDTESLSTYGVRHLPCATGKMRIFVNGNEISVLPDMKDRLSPDEVHQRYALLERDVIRGLDLIQGPQEVVIKEDHALSTLVFSSNTSVRIWSGAKTLVNKIGAACSVSLFAPADRKTSFVAKEEEQMRSPRLLASNTNLRTVDVH